MKNKVLLAFVFVPLLLSGCSSSIISDDSSNSSEYVPIVSMSERSIEAMQFEDTSITYTNLGIFSDTLIDIIKSIDEDITVYQTQTEQYNIYMLLNNHETQKCVIYCDASNNILCSYFMDTQNVLVDSESGSKLINKWISNTISAINIPESSYVCEEYADDNYKFSYRIYAISIDLAVLEQPTMFEIVTPAVDNLETKQKTETFESTSSSTNIANDERSGYEKILNEYTDKLSDATPNLIDEFYSEATSNTDGLSGLALISNSKVSVLAKICSDGVTEMATYMYNHGNGKYEEYEEWAMKLQDVYTKYATKIYDAYTDYAIK